MDWLRDLLKSKNPVLVAGGILLLLTALVLSGVAGGVSAYRIVDNRYETKADHANDKAELERRISAYIDNAAIKAAQQAVKEFAESQRSRKGARRPMKNDGNRDVLVLDQGGRIR